MPSKFHLLNKEYIMNSTEAEIKTLDSITSETAFPTLYWHRLDDGKVQCDLCPRHCALEEGQRGLCFVRGCFKGEIVLTTYGRSSGLCVDPIEKKPLYHFLPGSKIFSFGTAGCNLTCKFCQNWNISKSRHMNTLMSPASPQGITAMALHYGCESVAFTYNDPVIFMEYAIDTAKLCHEHNIKTVAVTAGYICPEPRKEFFKYLDAANIDLKGFSEDFYHSLCSASLKPVLDTLVYVREHTSTWLEITTLLIQGHNDSDKEIAQLSSWICSNLGKEVPLHFTAFHPDYRMNTTPPTPISTLRRAREIALSNGLYYVYTGNVRDELGSTTFCHNCHRPVIVRDGYTILQCFLDSNGFCSSCKTQISGVFLL